MLYHEFIIIYHIIIIIIVLNFYIIMASHKNTVNDKLNSI